MGCCTSKSNVKNIHTPNKVVKAKKIARKRIAKTKQPLSDETKAILERISKQGSFNCKFVGLHIIHNYLMFIRERVLSDKNQVILLDVRDKVFYDEIKVFRSEHFDLEQNLESEDKITALKSRIHFKYVFIIGDANDFNKPELRELLEYVLDKEMKPFALFFHRINIEIL